MKPTEKLISEHNKIKEMLRVAMFVCDRMDQGESIDGDHLKMIIDFIRGYADGYHHAKEENLLFPAMVVAGMPREAGPIGGMLVDHDYGRNCVSKMDGAMPGIEAGESEAAKTYATNLRDFGEMLAPHIFKEDNVLYPMADSLLSDVEQKQLVAQFAEVEEQWADESKRLLNLLDELKMAFVIKSNLL